MKKKDQPKVHTRLRELGDLFEKRNAQYGSDYKSFGAVLLALFPNGLVLETDADFTRFGLYLYMLGKMTRYSKTFLGHPVPADTLDDLSVYAQMLQDVDASLMERD